MPKDSQILSKIRRLPEGGGLHLTWQDGHRVDFESGYLRGFCPCAGCQGHSREAIEFQAPPGAVTVESIEPVGHYAVSFTFSDGHGTGIYRFDFLRAICPCSACVSARGGLHVAVSTG